MTIRRVLIANRGEIAVRIIRSCEKLGIETVLAVSTPDIPSLGARLATRHLCVGPGPSRESYLKVETIVQAAIGSGCDAIHPGYGFLSERAEVARLCEDEGIIFIGPTAGQIEAVGDKLRARIEAIAAGVPVVPGGFATSSDEARALAEEIGTPILIKAVSGGGGRGMKLVEDLAKFDETVAMASAEAEAAFGDGRVYLERYVTKGRHVEVQVLGDGRGHVIHLGERDCSVQRRYQKLIEETPAPDLGDDLREGLQEAATRFARHLAYRGAGTVEFLVDVERGQFYFLEMNARIQVEHPVTEEVCGVDLVAQQIAIAAGQGLALQQDDVSFDGAAIECRINAEDPDNAFAPSPGRVSQAIWPEGDGLRIDTHIDDGATVPPYYDSLIGKVIAHGRNRAEALTRLRRAIETVRIAGVKTNLAFHARVLADAEFAAGGVDTGYLARLSARASAGA